MCHLFIDTSGSMSEMGKDSGTVYIAKSIQDYCNFNNIEIKLHKFDGEIINTLHSLSFSNDVSFKSLRSLIEDNQYVSSLVLTDGLMEEDITIDAAVIAIGIDADHFNLSKIFKKVYEVENVISAIEYIINDDTMTRVVDAE